MAWRNIFLLNTYTFFFYFFSWIYLSSSFLLLCFFSGTD